MDGGPALTLCAYPGTLQLGGSWNRNGVIVFGTNAGFWLVSAAGGNPTLLTAPDTATGEAALRAPWFLPDGRHFLYEARHSDPGKTRIYVDSIDAQPDGKPGSKTRREVLAAASNAIYVPRVPQGGRTPGRGSAFGGALGNQGYLLFARGNALLAQPFDASGLRITGDAVPVAAAVDFVAAFQQSQFSASQTGILVYTAHPSAADPEATLDLSVCQCPRSQLTWFDRAGKAVGTVGTPATYMGLPSRPMAPRLPPAATTTAPPQTF